MFRHTQLISAVHWKFKRNSRSVGIFSRISRNKVSLKSNEFVFFRNCCSETKGVAGRTFLPVNFHWNLMVLGCRLFLTPKRQLLPSRSVLGDHTSTIGCATKESVAHILDHMNRKYSV